MTAATNAMGIGETRMGRPSGRAGRCRQEQINHGLRTAVAGVGVLKDERRPLHSLIQTSPYTVSSLATPTAPRAFLKGLIP